MRESRTGKEKVSFYLDFLGPPKVSSESLQLGNA
jgi:hypothetical protein